jgi:hypothetical protein
MRTLVYKRTHKGDPGPAGWFGIHDCMGSVKDWNFDAVIGIGGIGDEPTSHEIDGKVTWIGVGARKVPVPGRGPLVGFEHFVLFDEKGTDFRTVAPTLAHHIYSKNVRTLLSFNDQEQAEVNRILELARSAPPSAATPNPSPIHRCPKCVHDPGA